ncbi:MAG TPA: hypothetical protein PKE17_19625, partial [Saprospiraceae bacterium]|nr:hypothetical protein [Saprospiraceae bacterium]
MTDCSENVTVYYSFNLIESTNANCFFSIVDADVSRLGFDLSGNLAAAGITVSATPNWREDVGEGVFVEYALNGLDASKAGTYIVRIAYDDNDDGLFTDEPNVEVLITILAQQSERDYRNLSCSGTVNIRLDDDCEAQLRASQLLNGRLVCD